MLSGVYLIDQMKRRIIPYLLILIALWGCKKEVVKDRTEFIGRWHAQINYYDCIMLYIYENGETHYCINWQGNETNYFEKKTWANDKRLTFGNKYFKIIEYPHQIDTNVERVFVFNHYANDLSTKLANWKMTLKGVYPSTDNSFTDTYVFYKPDY